MPTIKTLPAVILAILGLTVACDDGGTLQPETGLTVDDLALVAVEGDTDAGILVFAQVFGAVPGRVATTAAAEEREFSRSRSCPAGGSIEIRGTVSRTQNGDGTVEATLTGTRSQVECARTRGEVTLVIDGTGVFEAYRKRVNGEPVGNQTTSYSGSFDWTRTRGDEIRTGSCTYDLESVRNPDSMKVRVTGTICDREIDRERDWARGT